ncbi:hypothetical protein GJ668_12480 [Allochromatium palmeri]|uniref:SWIM-type domain-containing protein n=1 Tax=Allochromatium palmeri TaxID=231048 RepID=A0A6N8ECJ1_9GAMM|nr:hypothetical protein [Allochromatium palmeri]
MNLSADELLRLAPDAASVKAAKGLVIPAKWPRLGHDETAVWGECRGYQIQIDPSGPAFRCSCPSRKFPCKHGLALGLLYLQHPDRFTHADPPDWVSEWLTSRAQRRERQKERPESASGASSTPADPRAAARREAERLRRLTDGLSELESWLADRLRQGLAQLQGQPEIWNAMAARLVDAQLPGLAERLRRAGALVGRSEHWPRQLLAELGRLQLLIDGARRLDALPTGEQADLRVALGLPQDKAAVLETGERLSDDWQVMGVHIAEEERLVMRRVWLQGRTSDRAALVLDYSYGQAQFEPVLTIGDTLAATLAFYPSAAPMRALFIDPPHRLAETASQPPAPLAEALERLAEQIAANPWPAVRALCLSGVPQPDVDGDWTLSLGESGALRLRLDANAAWPLVAAAGGSALTLFGEWDGESLRPLSAWGPELIWTTNDAGSDR